VCSVVVVVAWQTRGVTELVWRSASACGESGYCVEVAFRSACDTANSCVEVAKCDCPDGDVLIRDSKLGDASPVLSFTRAEWDVFSAGMKAGDFDV
jgi:hypothetical protein